MKSDNIIDYDEMEKGITNKQNVLEEMQNSQIENWLITIPKDNKVYNL